MTKYILDNCPRKYHARIVPDYRLCRLTNGHNGILTLALALGCKRTVIDTEYLACLHQDNVEVNWDGTSSIVENGIVTRKGMFD